MRPSIPIIMAVLVCTAMPAFAATSQKASPIRAVAAANRLATIEPTQGNFVNARQLYVWSAGSVYHVYTAPGMVTDIALQPGEALIAVAAGDTARWVIGDTTSGGSGSGSREAKQTHILVKPFAAGLSTNLVITTDRRTYHLRLSSSSGPAMAALSWTYPQDTLLALKRQAKVAEAAKPVASGLSVEHLHFEYRISAEHREW